MRVGRFTETLLHIVDGVGQVVSNYAQAMGSFQVISKRVLRVHTDWHSYIGSNATLAIQGKTQIVI